MIPDRVRAHEEAFNAAFRSGDRGPFADDAVMRFEGVPVGPYVGRPAIAAAYATRPPTDTMTVRHAESVGDTDVVRFAGDAGGASVLTVRWRRPGGRPDDSVRLSVTSGRRSIPHAAVDGECRAEHPAGAPPPAPETFVNRSDPPVRSPVGIVVPA